MKVRKKKTPSPSAPSPGNAEKTKGGDVKTKGTLKQNDGDDDEEDDDETLRGVTSLKIDPKVPVSVDEPVPEANQK
uniref:Uncharacterized protein n=1 Tax=Panagrolaimus davidi TaxID=227884 RepID=A0A914QJ72_9BILA